MNDQLLGSAVPAPQGDVALSHVVSPVGVFDAGIGSFDLVQRLHAAYPEQDILYLADRASFPYGAKDVTELLESVSRACRALIDVGAESIVLASNAPSVTVLERLRPRFPVPILGIKPPVRKALDSIPDDGVLAVAGARVMIESDALRRLIAAEAGVDASRVVAVAADGPIGLVESGAFLDRQRVREPIARFIDELRAQHPRIAGLTLSSTHLPWLRPALAEAAPDLHLFDPADGVVTAFSEHVTHGSGRILCLATESREHPLDEFLEMINNLGLDLSPILITM